MYEPFVLFLWGFLLLITYMLDKCIGLFKVVYLLHDYCNRKIRILLGLFTEIKLSFSKTGIIFLTFSYQYKMTCDFLKKDSFSNPYSYFGSSGNHSLHTSFEIITNGTYK